MNPIEVIHSKSRILVIGGGITGKAVIEFLNKFNCEVLLLDEKTPETNVKVTYFSDSSNLTDIGEIDFAIKSPGIKPSHRIILQLRSANIPIFSEIEIARYFFKGKVIGITGTDGKSTTTALTKHIIEKSFPNTKMGGNIGLPFISFCQEELDFAVLELSSYQLEDSNELNIHISAILNIAQDHLERHGTMENYKSAKEKIINKIDPKSIFVTNKKLEGVITYPDTNKIMRLLFGETKNCDAYISMQESKIYTKNFTYSTSKFTLEGKHNLDNLAASILICESALCSPESIQSAISDFNGLDYRFQKIKESNGITFINDSKSTNIHSLLSGLSGIKSESPFILILGGKQKEEDISPLLMRLKNLNVEVFLFGEARFHWEKNLLFTLEKRLHIYENLEQVVYEINNISKSNFFEKVIFSPGCASFDQYKNFEERGAHFTKLINQYF